MDSQFLSWRKGRWKEKKAFPKGVVEPAPLWKTRIRRISDTAEKEKSPPTHFKAGGDRNNKGAGFSPRDVTVLFQVVHEMLRRVGPHRHPVQFPVPPGEIHHVLPVGAPAVKPAALTQDAYKLGRTGGGNPAAIRQNTWSRFFYYRYFKCLKSLFDRLPSGMIAWIRMYRIFYLPDSIMVPAIRFFSAAVAFFLVASWSVTG